MATMNLTKLTNYSIGLTDKEVLESREKHGMNLLTPPKKASMWKLYLEKFNDPVIRILLVAAFFSLVISIIEGEYAETIGIFFAIFLATGIGFYFEYDANKKFELLNAVGEETPVTVRRNGKIQEIPRKEVVVGDIVILNTGEEVPADGVLTEAISLQINESNLTGELMVNKTTDEASFDEEATYPSNEVMRGTTVTDGHGTMQVVRVGDATEIGKVAQQATEQNQEETPLNIQLGKLAKFIEKVGFTIAGLTFIIFTGKGLVPISVGDRHHRLARMVAHSTHCLEILHDGRNTDCSSSTRRSPHECNLELGIEHAPNVEDQQPGAQDACMRNHGSHHRYLYRQDGYTYPKLDAGARSQSG